MALFGKKKRIVVEDSHTYNEIRRLMSDEYLHGVAQQLLAGKVIREQDQQSYRESLPGTLRDRGYSALLASIPERKARDLQKELKQPGLTDEETWILLANYGGPGALMALKQRLNDFSEYFKKADLS